MKEDPSSITKDADDYLSRTRRRSRRQSRRPQLSSESDSLSGKEFVTSVPRVGPEAELRELAACAEEVYQRRGGPEGGAVGSKFKPIVALEMNEIELNFI